MTDEAGSPAGAWAPVEIASARFVPSTLSKNRLGYRAIDVHHAGKQLVGQVSPETSL